ncbi:unnamed protein product [Pedinophyceae sp. YPF-701]|nr:unnamed protein product [Pedinophyceae sp. YPF-701]
MLAALGARHDLGDDLPRGTALAVKTSQRLQGLDTAAFSNVTSITISAPVAVVRPLEQGIPLDRMQRCGWRPAALRALTLERVMVWAHAETLLEQLSVITNLHTLAIVMTVLITGNPLNLSQELVTGPEGGGAHNLSGAWGRGGVERALLRANAAGLRRLVINSVMQDSASSERARDIMQCIASMPRLESLSLGARCSRMFAALPTTMPRLTELHLDTPPRSRDGTSHVKLALACVKAARETLRRLALTNVCDWPAEDDFKDALEVCRELEALRLVANPAPAVRARVASHAVTACSRAKSLRRLVLHNILETDKDVLLLGSLGKLEHLTILDAHRDRALEQSALKHLPSFPHLQGLMISWVNGPTPRMGCPCAHDFAMGAASGDVDAAPPRVELPSDLVAKVPALRELIVPHAHLTVATAAQLRTLPHLRTLSVAGTTDGTCEETWQLVARCPRLRTLRLSLPPGLGGPSMPTDPPPADAGGDSLRAAAAAKALGSAPSLRRLEVVVPWLYTELAEELGRLPKLTHLALLCVDLLGARGGPGTPRLAASEEALGRCLDALAGIDSLELTLRVRQFAKPTNPPWALESELTNDSYFGPRDHAATAPSAEEMICPEMMQVVREAFRTQREAGRQWAVGTLAWSAKSV